jgi:hypothetical protein
LSNARRYDSIQNSCIVSTSPYLFFEAECFTIGTSAYIQLETPGMSVAQTWSCRLKSHQSRGNVSFMCKPRCRSQNALVSYLRKRRQSVAEVQRNYSRLNQVISYSLATQTKEQTHSSLLWPSLLALIGCLLRSHRVVQLPSCTVFCMAISRDVMELYTVNFMSIDDFFISMASLNCC